MLNAGRARLDTTTALQLVAATAAAAVSKHSDTASEVAAYGARLQLLRVALHQSATAVVSTSAVGSGARVNTGERLLQPCLTHTRGMLHVLEWLQGSACHPLAVFLAQTTASCQHVCSWQSATLHGRRKLFMHYAKSMSLMSSQTLASGTGFLF